MSSASGSLLYFRVLFIVVVVISVVAAVKLVIASSSSPKGIPPLSSPSSVAYASAKDRPISSTPSSPNVAPNFEIDAKACAKPTLLGKEHAGGWITCSDAMVSLNRSCVVYSFGLGADWSFDNALEHLGCELHGFDPSGQNWRNGMHGTDYSGINYQVQYPSKLKKFHNWGLGAAARVIYPAGSIPQEWPGLGDPALSQTNSDPWEMKSVEQTMKDLGHLSTGITILKIDIEGGEWDALASFLGSRKMLDIISKGKIPQLMLEYHWDPESKAKNARHFKIIERIQDLGFIPFHVTRHKGSDCCLDVSYVWKRPRSRRLLRTQS